MGFLDVGSKNCRIFEQRVCLDKGDARGICESKFLAEEGYEIDGCFKS